MTQALMAAQAQMKDAPHDSKNPHFKSTYASLSSVRNATQAILAAHGLVITQTMDAGDEQRVCVVTTMLHTGGGRIESRLMIAALKEDPQAYGAAITYGRRYALAAICGISTEEDDDGSSGRSWPPGPEQQRQPERQQPTNSVTRQPVPASQISALQRLKIDVGAKLVSQCGSVDNAKVVLGTILPGRTSIELLSEHEAHLVALLLEAAVVCDTPAVVPSAKASLQGRIKSQLPYEQWTPEHVEAAYAEIRKPQLPPANGERTGIVPAPGHSAYGDHKPTF